jgi:serine/threonine protein kinase/Tfp pilus assembly protein PilF
MTETAAPDQENELDGFIAAYEAAQAREGQADLTAFLPEPSHPLYLEVLRELVRVDLEYGWTRGAARSLEDYQRHFPQLFRAGEDLQALTFEEYRLRRQAGEDPSPEDYQQRFGVDTWDWPRQRHASGSGRTENRAAQLFGEEEGETENVSIFYPPTSTTRRALDGMPEVGTEFLGFRLIAELGRGAFGRVYLAQQGELADRPVALKVSRDIRGESRQLAQLQHTNIVPVYSVHHARPFHAICMPFYGSTTLADVLRAIQGQGALPPSGKALVDTVNACKRTVGREEGGILSCHPGSSFPLQATASASSLKALAGQTYVEAVLWIGARLADGLGHAHDRGIVHGDLKPANVLLADDGQPMLLDFNLSEDIKLRSGAPAAFLGGTLPYMAPEHLLAFQRGTQGVDARSDLYALGVILYELLTGRHPFTLHQGPVEDVLARLLQDRLPPSPRLSAGNPAVSAAVESIVRHALEADPSRRYQTARELQEDLERQLKDLPLRHAREPSLRERARKWARRHPRLTSASSIAALAAALLLGLGSLFALRGERLARLEAVEAFNQFRVEMREVQAAFLEAPTAGRHRLEKIEASCRHALDRYQVRDNPSWPGTAVFRHLAPEPQEQLRADLGELLFLLAALTRVPADSETSPAQRANQLQRALELNRHAECCYPEGQVPGALWQQRGLLAEQLGEHAEAQGLLERAEATPPQTARDCCLRACLYTAQGHFRKALPLWEKASLQAPQNVWAWYGLGSCYDHLSRPAQAAACYSACIALTPDFAGWYFKRGLAHLKQREDALAGVDFDQAIRLQPRNGEAYMNRALARLGANRCAEAIQDLTDALGMGLTDARVYFLRAQAREKAGDLAGAQRDREDGLRREPADEAGWIARGVARVASAPQTALADFDRALESNPRSLPALENKAHVLAERLGRTEEAVQVLDRALALSPEHGPTRAARGILLARLGKREAALQDAEGTLSLDTSAVTLYQVAGIYALTSRLNADDGLRAFPLLASALRQGFGDELIQTDRDLDPLRKDPRFQQLLQAVRLLQPAPP